LPHELGNLAVPALPTPAHRWLFRSVPRAREISSSRTACEYRRVCECPRVCRSRGVRESRKEVSPISMLHQGFARIQIDRAQEIGASWGTFRGFKAFRTSGGGGHEKVW